MQILELRLDHVEEISHIENLTGLTPWPQSDFFAMLNEPGRWAGWVMIPDMNPKCSPIAFALLALMPPESELSKLAVHPAWQRRGVASALLARALEHARSRNCRQCFLEVRSRNSSAIAFYQKHGFVSCGRRKDYYRNPADDALLMLCSIHPA